ncbi:Mobile element protein, partial [hydrothermal vent metagenome]
MVREVTQKDEVIKGIRATEKTKTYLHANVAFTPERVCLGVVAANHWEREGKKNKAAQAKKPIEEKESLR